ncbi:hypothetical protein ACIREE_27415 [Streptomyces sp. NPDC102467]
MELLYWAADRPTPFWPTGAIVLVVITLITVLGWAWRERKMNRDE